MAIAMVAGCGPGGRQPGPAEPVVAPEPTEVAASSTSTALPPAPATLVEPSPAAALPAPPPSPTGLGGAELRRRYALASAKQLLIGDQGDGYEDLYGTRNVRAVLNGVFYRGGANNYFHRDGKRHNKNPLPADGLTNLCRQGFATSVYLYPTNFEQAARETTCQTVAGTDGTLAYEQMTTQHGKKSDLRLLFGWIQDSVRQPGRGAVYAHCWNGWHASGYVGAVALRQFCGFTGPQAVKYWNATAKGASKAEHDGTRERITKFKPFSEFSLTDEEQAALCPDPMSLKFAAPEPASLR